MAARQLDEQEGVNQLVRGMLEFLHRKAFDQWSEGIPTTDYLGAFSYPDEGAPGKYCISAVSQRGSRRFRRAELVEDSQSGAIESSNTPIGVSWQSELENTECDDRSASWTRLRNADAECGDRLTALRVCVEADEPGALRFLVDELCREEIAQDWQIALVLFAESVQFDDDEQRTRLWRRLLEIATSLRESVDEDMKSVVFSAIRCLASLIPDDDAGRLLPLLEPPKRIETRLVTLQAVVNIFEVAPPENVHRVSGLADRAFELADKFLDRDWLIPGEKAAIGLNATHAIAALGDGRLAGCVERIRSLSAGWFSLQVIQKLKSTLTVWKESGQLMDHPAVALLETQLKILAG
jgi:hypothetical protein